MAFPVKRHSVHKQFDLSKSTPTKPVTVTDLFGTMSDSSEDEDDATQVPLVKRPCLDSSLTPKPIVKQIEKITNDCESNGSASDSSDSDSSDSDSESSGSESSNVVEDRKENYFDQISSDSDSFDAIDRETSGDKDDNKKAPSPPAIKPQYDSYSTTSLRIMQNMGYTNDAGLGKNNQGQLEPVEATKQNGRRGFGLTLNGLDLAAQKWTPNMENIELREKVRFIANHFDDLDTKSYDELCEWVVVTLEKQTIDDETHFCNPKMLQNLLAQKSVFDKLGVREMQNARSRSNPFEWIGKSIFINRAAVKMANLDAMFDFMFTNPVDENGESLVKENGLLYFADVCAGPGGFSEYILWRKKWLAKGFGFTLKDENDFQLEKFEAGHPETFDAFYGINGDGNIYDPDNILSYIDYVNKQTTGGVHLMMSDGGFSVQGQENLQEILSKQLYVCQCLTALSIVRENGHFVTKVFDLFTPFSVGLIYLMYKCFKQISIVKPNSSRPANSERYLVCKWKKSNSIEIQQYLVTVSSFLFEKKATDPDITELVPMETIQGDTDFYNYICESNNTIGENQVNGLLKIAHFCNNKNLRDRRQAEIKHRSLACWGLPNGKQPRKMTPTTDNLFKEMLGNWYSQKEFMSSMERHATASKYKKVFFDNTDWAFVPVEVAEKSGKDIRTFFMSKGSTDVYKYTEHNAWAPLTEMNVEITPNTLVYGEIVKELTGEGKAQTMVYAMHIIDGMILGGMDIRNHDLMTRNRLCRKFAESLNKPQKKITKGNSSIIQYTAAIRCKKMLELRDFRKMFSTLNQYKLKDNKIRPGLLVDDAMHPNRFYVPRGLMLFKLLKPNLYKQFVPSRGKHICEDLETKHRFYLEDIKNPELAYGSFKSTFAHRKLWKWEDPRQVAETIDDTCRQPDLLYRVDFEKFIYKNEE